MKVVNIMIILSLVSCGMYEEDINLMNSENNLIIKQRLAKGNNIHPVSLSILLKKVEVSISDNESRLFEENLSNKFQINSVINLYIAAKFSNYSGSHNIGIRIYLPDGNLYISKNTDVDFNANLNYSSNGIIIENKDNGLIAEYILPVAGVDLSIFNLSGKYRVEFLLDQNIVVVSEFILE